MLKLYTTVFYNLRKFIILFWCMKRNPSYIISRILKFKAFWGLNNDVFPHNTHEINFISQLMKAKTTGSNCISCERNAIGKSC